MPVSKPDTYGPVQDFAPAARASQRSCPGPRDHKTPRASPPTRFRHHADARLPSGPSVEPGRAGGTKPVFVMTAALSDVASLAPLRKTPAKYAADKAAVNGNLVRTSLARRRTRPRLPQNPRRDTGPPPDPSAGCRRGILGRPRHALSNHACSPPAVVARAEAA